MTTPTTSHLLKTRSSVGVKKSPDPIPRLLEVIAETIERAAGAQWPNPIFADDPVLFADRILGVELAPKQVEILLAICDNKRVAVRGGRKVGKDFVVAIAALWWFCSFVDARVVITATTAHQVDEVLWLEIRKLWSRSGRCLACKRAAPRAFEPCEHSAKIGGDMHELARSGLKSADFRMITGHTAREAESMAGISGARLMHITDEASGVRDEIHTAIRGNLASEQSREVMISNPTKTTGHFFNAFHGPAADLYAHVHASSEETPNVVAGREVFPGLADRAWVEECKREWGEKSATYRIHVKGEFCPEEAGQLLSVHDITEAIARWPAAPAEGLLQLGLDPSGESGAGDDMGIAAARGQKVLEVYGLPGLKYDGQVEHVVSLLAKYRRPGEVPIVHVDCDGEEGWEVYKKLREVLEKPGNENLFRLVQYRGNWPSNREGNFDRHRDAVWANVSKWVRAGGALPEDRKLRADLHAPKLTTKVDGKSRATDKKELRKILGRSPDRGDAVCLAVWPVYSYSEEHERESQQRAAQRSSDEARAPAMDPYGALDTWRRP